MMGAVTTEGCDLYYEESGDPGAVPILLVPPAGTIATTWGAVTEELAQIGRVITYDRRGYARSGGDPVRSINKHTADAVAILEQLCTEPAVIVGTSAGATIAVDLAVRRPELVRAVIAHEAAWRASRHLPNSSQIPALATLAWLTFRRQYGAAADTLLRAAYSYRDGQTAWDAFPQEWRRVARENGRAALWDFRNSIGNYPKPKDLVTIHVPVVCTYGARSPLNMADITRSLAATIPHAQLRRIEGAGHAAPFDATDNFVCLIAEAVASSEPQAASG